MLNVFFGDRLFEEELISRDSATTENDQNQDKEEEQSPKNSHSARSARLPNLMRVSAIREPDPVARRRER
jgi:hypothetical protein